MYKYDPETYVHPAEMYMSTIRASMLLSESVRRRGLTGVGAKLILTHHLIEDHDESELQKVRRHQKRAAIIEDLINMDVIDEDPYVTYESLSQRLKK